MSYKVTPKSFRLATTIKTTEYKNITKRLRRKLITYAQNEEKKRFHESKNRTTNLCWLLC